jgi:hypothetical protein
VRPSLDVEPGWREVDEGDRARQDCERLLRDLDGLTLVQVRRIAAAWHRMPRHGRDRARAAARRVWRAIASDEPLDRACTARRAAARAARRLGVKEPTLAAAACEATLAVASAGRLAGGDYQALVAPLALALPWLLGQPPGASERPATATLELAWGSVQLPSRRFPR